VCPGVPHKPHARSRAPRLPTFTAGKTRPKPLRLNLPSDLRYNVSTLVPERVLRHRSTPLKPSGVTNYHGPIRLTAGRAFSCYGVSWVSFDPVESRNIDSHITSSLSYLFFLSILFFVGVVYPNFGYIYIGKMGCSGTHNFQSTYFLFIFFVVQKRVFRFNIESNSGDLFEKRV
jgi:hypothetical protein